MAKHIAVRMECIAFCTLEFSLNPRMVKKHPIFVPVELLWQIIHAPNALFQRMSFIVFQKPFQQEPQNQCAL